MRAGASKHHGSALISSKFRRNFDHKIEKMHNDAEP